MTMILPDSTIEAAARAYRETDGFHVECIAAALTAALPDLIEICAKACEEVDDGYDLYCSAHYAEVIRSLLTNPEDK